jgi:Tfp pilus assembly protein FimT
MAKVFAVKSFNAAFSLIELCILMASIGILGVFAAPMLSSTMHSMQLSAETRNIATALTSARLSATSQMIPYRVSFNLGENSWQVEKYNQVSGEFEIQQSEYNLSNGLANSGIAFKSSSSHELSGFPSASSTAITFNVRGFPVDSTGAPTTNNVIYISDAESDRAITVSLTGKVQVLKNSDGEWICH